MDEVGDGERREKALSVNGADLVLTLDVNADLLTVYAAASDVFRPAFAENQLGEPLRILFGQPIYPRFVLRRSSTWSMGWVRPSPSWSPDSDACALWQSADQLTNREGFWDTLRRLLSYVVTPRDAQGHPNWEANRLTDLYGEVIQAARGSRWVWALTYASAAEGIVDMLGLEGARRVDMDEAAIADLAKAIEQFKEYIDKWDGDPRPVQPAKNAADRMLRTTAAIALRHLKAQGWVTKDELDAWDRLRNKVMHGKLVSPYSSAEDDRLLLNLSGLLHALTRRLIADIDPDALLPSEPRDVEEA
jgi:hypothetical protein